jgi:ribose transport system permease protein
MTGKTVGIDTSLLIWLAIILLVSFVLAFTTFGRRVYAVGNSERVAHLAGVNVKLVTVSLYALSGLFAALAGIALTGFGGSATLGMGILLLYGRQRGRGPRNRPRSPTG